MDDGQLLRQLRRKEPAALERAIAQYSAYVMTIIRGRSRGMLTEEDQQELASDVFLILWQQASGIARGRLKPWLGAVARNQTVQTLRRKKCYVPLEDDVLVEPGELWQGLYEKQRAVALARALRTLSAQGREIFYRFYDLTQTTAQIAETMGLNASTVRSRLKRGREALRQELCKGGVFCEDELGCADALCAGKPV